MPYAHLMTPADDKVRADEQRKLQQHEQVKSEIRDEVHREIKARSEQAAAPDAAQVGTVAHQMKQRAVREVLSSEAELTRSRTLAHLSQVIDYAFYVLYGLIALLIVLELIGAREGSGFKQLLNAVTGPFLAPFKGLMPDPVVGSFQLMTSYIIGLVVYFMLHMAVNGALRLFVLRKTSV